MADGARGPRFLDGVQVVEITDDESFPLALASKLLADLGADVTVINLADAPSDAVSPSEREWRFLLDLVRKGTNAGPTTPDDPAVAGIVAAADIVIASDSAALADHKLDYRGVADVNADVVYGVATAFGDDDAYAGWQASDLVLQSLGGMLKTTGQPGEGPTKVGARVADHLGALYLAIGTIAGLIKRRRVGTGRFVTLSQVDAVVSSTNNFVAEYTARGHLPPALGNRHLASSPWNSYKAKDGYVVICLVTDRQWDNIATLMGHHELAGNPDYHGQHNRRPRADELDALVADWAKDHTVKDILAAMAEQEIPCGDIPFIDQVLGDDSLINRGLITKTADGSVELGSVVRLAGEVVADGPAGRRSLAEDLGVDAPLAGLRVVEIAMLAAGPVAGRILGNLGADVIKIEPKAGEAGRHVPPKIGETSAVFNINCNDKRSLCIDLTQDPGTSIAKRIMSQSDVVIENLSPGRLASWGLGYADVAHENPGIVCTSVTGFGQTSSGTRLRAYDTVVQAVSGLMQLTGFPDGLPTKAGISLSDFFSGVTGALSTLAALAARQRDVLDDRPARSVHLDVAMYDVTVWTSMAAWPRYLLHGEQPTRVGNGDRYAWWQDLVACTDDVAAVTLRDTDDAARLLEVIGQPSAGDPVANDVDAAVRAWASERTVADVVAALQGAGVPASPLRNIPDFLDDRGLKERAVLDLVEHPADGTVPVMGVPIQMSDFRVATPRPGSILGQHTREILAEVGGYSPEEIDAFLSDPSVLQA